MTTGYEECPDRDPEPTLCGIMLDLALLLAIIEIVLVCAGY
jgi:hypothetical protein